MSTSFTATESGYLMFSANPLLSGHTSGDVSLLLRVPSSKKQIGCFDAVVRQFSFDGSHKGDLTARVRLVQFLRTGSFDRNCLQWIPALCRRGLVRVFLHLMVGQ